MREAHARNPQLRRSAVGLKKRCGHCGQEGHNRKTCPQLVDTAAGAGGAANVTRAAAVTPAAAAPASKVIVIEEVDEKPLASEPALSNGISNDTSVKALGVPYNDLLPTRQLAPGMALSPEGGWIFLLPRSKEECVTQAAQAVLRAWDDGMRRHTVELLLPQADPSADGGWPGGIRQQFRVAKPMVESLLLRLKQHEGLGGRITAELLDEGDCVGAWQSERLGAVLFPTADTLPDLRRIDDALSGERLTLVINPQWQIQGQVISDFGIGRTRKVAERFVAAFEEVYYLRRVRVFGDDVRIMRCYPGQWQVHYVPSDPRANTVLLSCEDAKPTFQRLIQLLKAVRGSRASKTWLDRVLTASMGSFNEFAAYSPEAAAAAAAAVAGDDDSVDGRASTGGLASSTEGLQQQPGQEEQIAGTNLQRDIVTGELLPSDDDETPVRDIRLDPLHGVKQITKWLP
ncbi:expressed protein [Chlorella variabilis]|uniref:Expressed protein n=1 Tax=Chlorella variabilis TaxID=554065 RepID=E1ZTN4_CHLVA|nr:expressed protein [Chlorella variabilis]EFN50839.1 expressed protein [Chlorella variabilis]|eukprot:XP_005842941.1 expressed protein [Chlorella variabilis]